LEKPGTYKTKSLRKEGEIWSTQKKEEKKEKEKKKERTEETKEHSAGVQFTAGQEEEKSKEKEEEKEVEGAKEEEKEEEEEEVEEGKELKGNKEEESFEEEQTEVQHVIKPSGTPPDPSAPHYHEGTPSASWKQIPWDQPLHLRRDVVFLPISSFFIIDD